MHQTAGVADAIDKQRLRHNLATYQRPCTASSTWQLVNTLVPFALLWAAAYYTLQVSFWLALPVILLASGFLIRTFIIFHDCGHQSFFRSRRVNNFWGFVTGILTFTPYFYWTKNHARHHATSGNLDKRGQGDVWMMTVDEYMRAPRKQRMWYRFYRHPFVMLVLGPLFLILVTHRFSRRKVTKKERLGLYFTNVGILIVAAGLSWAMGLKAYLIIQFFTLLFGLMFGVWLFYVQHQFEGVYWSRNNEWDFVEASLEGGSFYDLPIVLRWFTGSIGYHHIHHLNPRIPNYRLARCQDEISDLQRTPRVGFFASLKALGYRLWDEESNRLIGFREARALHTKRRTDKTATADTAAG